MAVVAREIKIEEDWQEIVDMSLRALTLILYMCVLNVLGTRDSLNVILPPGGRECFFDNIPMGSPPRSIEVFVPSGSNVDVMLEV